jgi:hypothetical protein
MLGYFLNPIIKTTKELLMTLRIFKDIAFIFAEAEIEGDFIIRNTARILLRAAAGCKTKEEFACNLRLILAEESYLLDFELATQAICKTINVKI